MWTEIQDETNRRMKVLRQCRSDEEFGRVEHKMDDSEHKTSYWLAQGGRPPVCQSVASQMNAAGFFVTALARVSVWEPQPMPGVLHPPDTRAHPKAKPEE